MKPEIPHGIGVHSVVSAPEVDGNNVTAFQDFVV